MPGTGTSYTQGETQTVAYTATAGTIPNPTSAGVTLRIYCSTEAYIRISSTKRVATSADMPIAAGAPEYFTVQGPVFVSAIQQTSGGNLFVTEMA